MLRRIWFLLCLGILCAPFAMLGGCQGCGESTNGETVQEPASETTVEKSADEPAQEPTTSPDEKVTPLPDEPRKEAAVEPPSDGGSEPQKEPTTPEKPQEAIPEVTPEVLPEPTKEVQPEVSPTSCTSGHSCFQLDKAGVRACEMVFALPQNVSVQSVKLHPSVRGRSKQMGQRFAILFFWKSNQPLPSNQFAFQLFLGTPKPSVTWSAQKFTCYDWNGRKINNVRLLTKER